MMSVAMTLEKNTKYVLKNFVGIFRENMKVLHF